MFTLSSVQTRISNSARSFVILTTFAHKSGWAGAFVIHTQIGALSTILAWLAGGTWSHIFFAVYSFKTSWAFAGEFTICQALAIAIIFAWVLDGARMDVFLASMSSVTGRAFTEEIISLVAASSIVDARFGCARSFVCLASQAFKSLFTFAEEHAALGVAVGIIETRIWVTWISDFTSLTSVTIFALAEVHLTLWIASSIIQTRAWLARVSYLAFITLESCWTVAEIFISFWITLSIVLAWIWGAWIRFSIFFASVTIKTLWAIAEEHLTFRVTIPSIHTRVGLARRLFNGITRRTRESLFAVTKEHAALWITFTSILTGFCLARVVTLLTC